MQEERCATCGKHISPGELACLQCLEDPRDPSNARSSFQQWFSRRTFLAGVGAGLLGLVTAPWNAVLARPLGSHTHVSIVSRDLSFWKAEGRAFAQQPIFGDKFSTSQVKPGLVPLGGDYWDGPYPVGNLSNYWLSTENEHTGSLTSHEFAIDANYPWFSFQISGHTDLKTHRLELLVRVTATNVGTFATQTSSYPLVTVPGQGKFYRIYQATGHGTEIMRQEVLNVGWLAGEPIRVRIIDNSTLGHINISDIHFLAEAPQVAVNGGAVNTPLWGWADIHTHPAANLAFGSAIFWGQPDGPIDQALAWCSPLHGADGTGIVSNTGPLMAAAEQKGYGIDIGHGVGGFPLFDGWPKFTTIIHQQMYIDWLKRSYQGGLRLIVAHAVNNEALANAFNAPRAYDDITMVEVQIAALKALASRHSDWMEIAYTPADARRIIGENKLVIVLGIEVDTLGGFGDSNTCVDADVLAYLQHVYHDLGVRHLFPIHVANNAFGGTQMYMELFNVDNHYLRGKYYEVEDGSATGVQFRLGEDTEAAVTIERDLGVYNPPDYSKIPGGHVNRAGLTTHGNYMIQAMMSLGIIIDVDHMSQKSVDGVLGLAELYNYPVVLGHTGFRELSWQRGTETNNSHKYAHEGLKTAATIQRIRNLGGVIAPITNQDDIRPVSDVIPSLTAKVNNDCAGSTKTWAQSYLYAITHMGGQGVAIGTDVNGFARFPAPRFGMNAGYNLDYNISGYGPDTIRKPLRAQQVAAQSNGVHYNAPIISPRHYRFEGVLLGDVYNTTDQDIWQAMGLYNAGLNPWTNDTIPDATRPALNFAKGFFATSKSQLDILPDPLDLNSPFEEKTAFLVKTGQQPSSSDARQVRDLYPKVLAIWQRWQAMQGNNTPLTRSYAGQRDFDINIDGVAHYGMLPDMLQDLKNVGLTDTDLIPLFRSANDYIVMWEKCEQQKQQIQI
ncbi:membrane dipeptidase [Ktedonobacter robiniae]|uniref:membrane dipeptidase n=1 Tax=Ktedonobacter robiniae TaxID=2778365 RepID=UPI0019151126|nr:membrane dipeptidase [Ktedonobacter robiniae]